MTVQEIVIYEALRHQARLIGRPAEALMATGWANDGAVLDQIDVTLADALLHVRRRLPEGESLRHCEECGEEIHQVRRDALRAVRLCIARQTGHDREAATFGTDNRRGSMDSQLRWNTARPRSGRDRPFQ